MRLELERRAAPSKMLAFLSPLIALAMTMFTGILVFVAMGINPLDGLYAFFIEPLTETWSIHELVIKASP
ncbi:MAG: ABC transporter permease, partial [Salaquimonas sp.]